ncbi:MAG: efflux RND transporter periplasmic adaptor subunit [Gemmatimonadota bacterium]
MRRARRKLTLLGAVALAGVVLAACHSTEAEAEGGMAGMTPEEHARMQAGGTQGAMDSTGAAVRQAVHLTAEQETALGIVYTTARRETLERTIRTVGRIEAAEPRIVDVTPKIDGFVEKLYVSTTGEAVRRGQPLLTIYSPVMVAAQEELLTARRLVSRVDPSAEEAWRNAQETLEAARRRLSYWDITKEQIDRIERTREVTKTLTLVSPVNGIVLEKEVFEGQGIVPGQQLYRLADLTEVWVEGEVFEQDLQFIDEGAQAHIEVEAYPGEHIMGRVSFVYPTVDERSRTNRMRVTVPNPDLRLKPGMFATIFFDTKVGDDLLTLPFEAVLVTGERNLVFVRGDDGMLAPREVVLGPRAGNRVQILSGLAEGERVVGSANFLVDSESRLAGTGGGMPGMQHQGHGAAIEPEPEAGPAVAPPPGEAGGQEHD